MTYVGIGTGIGHAQDTWASVSQREVFVCKLASSINTLSTHPIVMCIITRLNHEIRNNAMERRASIFCLSTERFEILARLRNDVSM
jgi:hypothetical protein